MASTTSTTSTPSRTPSFATLPASQPGPSLEYATISDLHTAVDSLRTYLDAQCGSTREMLRAFENARYRQDNTVPTLLRSVDKQLGEQGQKLLTLEKDVKETKETLERLERLMYKHLVDPNREPTPTEAGGSPQPDMPETNGPARSNGEANGVQAGQSATTPQKPNSPRRADTQSNNEAGPSANGQTHSHAREGVSSNRCTEGPGPQPESERKRAPPLTRQPKLGLPFPSANGYNGGRVETNGAAGPSTRPLPDHSLRVASPVQSAALAESRRRTRPLARANAMDLRTILASADGPGSDTALSGSVITGNGERIFSDIITEGLSASEGSLLLGSGGPTEAGSSREGRRCCGSAANGDPAESRGDATGSAMAPVPESGTEETHQGVAASIEANAVRADSSSKSEGAAPRPSTGFIKEESSEPQTTDVGPSQAVPDSMPDASSSGPQLRRSQRTKRRRVEDTDAQTNTTTAAKRGGVKRRKTRN
ncbi:hypothetical protein GLOTRDRAFT_131524 [Gloeophyllum trabeum ATCC 11539]|uniref:Uncharacterized protein n=1 Tax=Gloeophyllum trabeum (strain ATCC 11539 / FP-39264 / Madison 617) TaxID=670483 RepID=S7RG89_GLOTA|nr:uncharacterized protein GLOTRDRAFT_131524 [Gloeophyllum trabeum ATCC 11539]EPQ53250.1 hypothetical protein GLOTRDRAFT_131524 [Gloeophyllum trabeum ATCC 11539]